ncbi:MAG: hypothetical protein SGJ27_25590 [Candidatus Melainabacteria bacterium]|nr:hypothetical protein [Candidatus Melainabacteria bacterium]
MAQTAESLTKAPVVAIEWNPVNWFAATWRDNEPLIKQPPRRFDVAEATNNVDNYVVNWLSAPCDMSLSKDEAMFWFSSCFGQGMGDFTMLIELTSILQGKDTIDLDTMKSLLGRTRFQKDRAHGLVPIQVLDKLMTSEDLVKLFCEMPAMIPIHTQYRKYILPFLSAEQKQSVQKELRICLEKSSWESSHNFAYYLAAALGLHDVTLELVKSWADNYKQSEQTRDKNLHLIVFGLGSADLVSKHFHRLKLQLTDHEQVISWIAHTEDTELETIYRSLEKAPFGTDEASMIKVVNAVRSVKTAEFMFDLYLNDVRFKSIASEWLQTNMRETVEAMVGISSRSGEKADQALAYLQTIRNNLGDAVIRELASDMPPKAVKRLNKKILQQAK